MTDASARQRSDVDTAPASSMGDMSARLAAVVIDTRRSPHATLHPTGIANVRIADDFWSPRRDINERVTLAIEYEQCRASGALDNFRRAAGQDDSPFQGRLYADSDVYKWIEAASWTLAESDDTALQSRLDEVIGLVAAAQEEDGYLNTYFVGERAGQRWTNLTDLHELYCGGHLVQAAIAHHRATGSRPLLDVAIKWVDCVESTFGPDCRSGTDGHPEIEMALVELYRETGERRYLNLAQFFLDQRGRHSSVLSGRTYHLDHAPVQEQKEAVGHAVRALYLYCGMADVALETGDSAPGDAVTRLWQDIDDTKVYLTGGVGARWEGESIGDAYELPNARAYAETCAAVARVMLAWRLLLSTGHGKYRDAMEWTLYNAVLPGVNTTGDRFFYQNPLADRGRHERQPWFETACCPPNLARMLAELPGLMYSTSSDQPSGANSDSREIVWLHLPIGNNAHVPLGARRSVELTVDSALPWRGEYTVRIEHPADVAMELRLPRPAWASAATVTVNDQSIEAETVDGYLALRSAWRAGDVVKVDLVMPVLTMQAHPRVLEDTGRVAIARGPLVYCLEQVDNPVEIDDFRFSATQRWESAWIPNLIAPGIGATVLRTEATVETIDTAALYRDATQSHSTRTEAVATAVPYFLWQNRSPGPMQVWHRG